MSSRTAREAKYGCSARVASGGGRMYVTMDRYEADWGIVQRGWEAHVLGEAPNKFKSGLEAVTELRKAEGAVGEDQFLRPFVVVGDDGNPLGPVQDNDAVLIFNFRSARPHMTSSLPSISTRSLLLNHPSPSFTPTRMISSFSLCK